MIQATRSRGPKLANTRRILLHSFLGGSVLAATPAFAQSNAPAGTQTEAEAQAGLVGGRPIDHVREGAHDAAAAQADVAQVCAFGTRRPE